MYYEINVTLRGIHFFATAERSLIDFDKAISVFNQFKQKFPDSEGYAITLTEWRKSGTCVAATR